MNIVRTFRSYGYTVEQLEGEGAAQTDPPGMNVDRNVLVDEQPYPEFVYGGPPKDWERQVRLELKARAAAEGRDIF